MAAENIRSWAKSEGLSDQIADTLVEEEFELDDLRAMTPDDVTHTFQTSKLLSVKQCLALRKAIQRLAGGVGAMNVGDDSASYNPGHVMTAFFERHSVPNQPPRLHVTGEYDRTQPKKQGLVKRLFGGKEEPKEEFRILLLGKTGSGKSQTGNTILGEKRFRASTMFSSVTTDCEIHRAEKDGCLLEIMDCPGLFDTSKTQDEVSVTIVQAVGCTHPGPHVILYVIRAGRYTAEDFGVYGRLKALFDDSITKHMVVLFTGGDDLKRENVKLADVLKSAPKELLQVVEECGHRCLIFDNTVKDNRQVDTLFEQIRRVKAMHGDQPFSCPKYAEIGEGIDKEVNRRLEAVYKRELEKEGYIKQLEENFNKIQQELEDFKTKAEEKEKKAKREIEKRRKRDKMKEEELRNKLEEKLKAEIDEQKKKKEQEALEKQIEAQRREQQEMLERMERERREEREEIRRREREQRVLEERRYREQREMEERKERAYREQMYRMKDGLARNEEPSIVGKVVDGVKNAITAPFRAFKSLFS